MTPCFFAAKVLVLLYKRSTHLEMRQNEWVHVLKVTRAGANAILILLRLVRTEGDTLPFQNGIDSDFTDGQ